MSYETRRELYKQIEEARGMPLITYVTSLRQNASGQIAPDVIAELIRQLKDIPAQIKEVDFLIVSNGGDPIVAWRLVNLLRERFERFNVLLPYTAYSAATLIALGANSIVMHPYASLGPVDPQITSTRQNEGHPPETKQFGSEDLAHYLAFVKENVGITDQEQLQNAFELLCHDVGALGIGSAKRSSQLMLSLGEKLLTLHTKDKNEARTIAESLNKSYYHHVYSVGRREAQELRLNVDLPSMEVEQLMWAVWEDFSVEMKCDVPFIPLAIVYESTQATEALDTATQLTLPANLPPPVMQQVLNQIMQQPIVQPVVPVPFDVFYAAVESTNGHSHFHQAGDLRAVRLPNMEIIVNITAKSQRWSYLPFAD
ncbi:MAG: hypothetical protein M9936_30950 [Caldilinea sp.]|nr:hypothetical protein [Caldilinea sp.]MCW5843953.1 hypothetical protein [Caldilinea sp.]